MQQVGLLSNIINAFKKNLVPGLFLQLFAVSICLSYYFLPASRPVFDFFAALKSEYGPVYSFFSTSLFGGVIPFIYLYFARRITKNAFKYLLFTSLFWAYKGVEIDYLYTFQGYWFGNDNETLTIFKKTFVDQFVYGPLWAVPTMTIGMMYPKNNYSLSLMKQELNKELFTIKMPTILITNMLVWIPTVSVVYMMPAPLQLPVSNLALCFFVLILAVLTKNTE